MVTPFCGLPSSSRTTSSSLRPPSTPPPPLTSSIAIASPRLMASPEAADPPDTAAARPSFTDGCCASGTPVSSATATTATDTISLPLILSSSTRGSIAGSPRSSPFVARSAVPSTPAPGAGAAAMLYADLRQEAGDRRLHVGAMGAVGKVAAALDHVQPGGRNGLGHTARHGDGGEMVLAAADDEHRAADAGARGQPVATRVGFVEQRQQGGAGVAAQARDRFGVPLGPRLEPRQRVVTHPQSHVGVEVLRDPSRLDERPV